MASNRNCNSLAGAEPSFETWENLKICMVQKSGVFVVRESPLMNSETTKQFIGFEDKLNKKYLRKLRERENIPIVVPDINEDVIVVRDNKCYRGVIKDRCFEKFSEYASVYLVDYGMYVEAEPSMIFHMHSERDKACASETHQAKYVVLEDVSPMSLDYTFDSGELKLQPKAAATWDDSAIKFMSKLIELCPLAHFHCLSEKTFEGNSIYYGHLYVDMTDAVKSLTQIHFQSYTSNCRRENLSDLLINCKFAIKKTDIAKSKDCSLQSLLETSTEMGSTDEISPRSVKNSSLDKVHLLQMENMIKGRKLPSKFKQDNIGLNSSLSSDSQSSSSPERFCHNRSMHDVGQLNKDHSPKLSESLSIVKKTKTFVERRKALLFEKSIGFETTSDSENSTNISHANITKAIISYRNKSKNALQEISMASNNKKELLSSHSHHFSITDIENIESAGEKGYDNTGPKSSFVTRKSKGNNFVSNLVTDLLSVGQNIGVYKNTKYFENLLQKGDQLNVEPFTAEPTFLTANNNSQKNFEIATREDYSFNSKTTIDASEPLSSNHINLDNNEDVAEGERYSAQNSNLSHHYPRVNESYSFKDKTYSSIPMAPQINQTEVSSYFATLASAQKSSNGEKKPSSSKAGKCVEFCSTSPVKEGESALIIGHNKAVVKKIESHASSEGDSNNIAEYVEKQPFRELKIPEKGNRHNIASKNVRRGRDSLTKSPSQLQNSPSKNKISEGHCNSPLNAFEQTRTCYSFCKINSSGSPSPLPRWASPKLVGTLNPIDAVSSGETTEESLFSLTNSNNSSDSASTGIDESSPEDSIADDSAVVLKQFLSENIDHKFLEGKLADSKDCSDVISTGKDESCSEGFKADEAAVIFKKSNPCENNVQISIQPKISDDKYYCNSISRKSNYGASGQSFEQDMAKSYRIYNGGHENFTSKHAVICESDVRNIFNEPIVNKLKNEDGKIRIRKLQSYVWPAISNEGSSCFVISGKRTGKTIGYATPLLSNLLDSFTLNKRKHSCGAGPLMIVLCSSWEKVSETTEAFINLLPDRISRIKIISGWGGMGNESEQDLRRQIFIGCDVFVTTPSCLLRLAILDEEADLICITFSKINYLVIDDADKICKLNFDKICCIYAKWRKSFSNRSSDDSKQLVVTAETWSKHIYELYKIVSGIFQSRIIISAHLESAVTVRVQTIIYFAKDKQSPLSIALQLMKETLRKSKTIIFVDTEEDGKHVKNLLESVAIPSDFVCSQELMWRVREIVYKWKQSSSFVIIVSDQLCNQLYQFDLMDANAILQIGVPDSELLFGRRYSFMLANYSSDINKKSNVVSHVILSKETVQRNPYVVGCLERLDAVIPKEMECISSESVNFEIKKREHTELCHYVKALGSCDERKCTWRHNIVLKDKPKAMPFEGEVEFQVIDVVDASRYFVLLSKHIDPTTKFKIDLGHFYTILFMKLQQYYCKREHLKVLKGITIKVGIFIAVHVKGKFWARGKIMKVDDDHKHVAVLFIDEGFSQIRNINTLYYLPDNFMIMPPMCVEVYLCNVQPMDKNLSWTLVATNTIKNILVNPKSPRTTVFRGKINFALNNILWLGPVKPLIKIGTHICPEVALRSLLCTQGFGEDNPLHLKRLHDLWQSSELSTLKLSKNGWHEHYMLGESALKSVKQNREYSARSINSMISENSAKSEFPVNNHIFLPPTVTTYDSTTKTNINEIVVNCCEINSLTSSVINHNENSNHSSFAINRLGPSDVAKEKSSSLYNMDGAYPKLKDSERYCDIIFNSKDGCNNLNFEANSDIQDVETSNINEKISHGNAVYMCALRTENKMISQENTTLHLSPMKIQSDTEPMLSEDEEAGKLLCGKSCDEDISNLDDSLKFPQDIQKGECSNEPIKTPNEMSDCGNNFLESSNDEQLNELELFCNNDDFESNAIVPLDRGRSITEENVLFGEERMNIGDILEIDVAEIISPIQFYIRKAKNNDRLSHLEEQIQLAIEDLKIFDDCRPGNICLSQFNDGRFYRAQIVNVQNEFCSVFFLDHGETKEINKTKIYPCPLHIFESMPAQCLECQLTDVTIPDHLLLEATESMEEIVDDTGIWMLQVMDIGTRDGNIVYIVDLIDTTRSVNKFLTKSLLEKKVVLLAGGDLRNSDSRHKIVEIIDADAVIPSETKNSINLAEIKFDFTQPLDAVDRQFSECVVSLQDEQIEVNDPAYSSDGVGQTTLLTCDQEYKKDISCGNSIVTTNNNGDMLHLNNRSRNGDISKSPFKSLTGDSNEIATPPSLEGINIKALNSETEQNYDSHSKTDSVKCDCKLSRKKSKPRSHHTKVKNKLLNKLIQKRYRNDKMPSLEDFSAAEKNNATIRNPGTYWRQDEEKIFLRFSLFDVSEFECKLYSKKLIFQTSVKDTMYNFHEELFAAIDPDKSFLKTQSLYTAVTLQKQRKEIWPRLLLKDGPVPWLRKDVSADDMDDSDSSENGSYSNAPMTNLIQQKRDSHSEWNGVRMLPSEPSDFNSDSYSSSDDDIFRVG